MGLFHTIRPLARVVEFSSILVANSAEQAVFTGYADS